GRPEADNSMVGLHFIDRAQVDKVVTVGSVINHKFVLKPGVADQKVFASQIVPKNIHLWSVSPHMHMLGRQMKMVATLPDGTKIPLIWVKDWDFNWQQNFRYTEPIALPAGSRVDLMAVYDNSDRNPRQTAHPPRVVRWGEQTSDEMCIGFFTFTLDDQHLLGTRSAEAPSQVR
ncbi:MAG: hypothetical protein LC772_11240, partial [Chloroflexi bacterium]|nr:hypothetical protein [Chloroflexota bacterium]